MDRRIGELAIVGCGATSLFFLKHILDNVSTIGSGIDAITVFEKSALLGVGMPYNPETTDRYNLSNISSEEIPELPETFYEWLSQREPQELAGWGIELQDLSKTEVYGRLPLGCYFHCQYQKINYELKRTGIEIYERACCEVLDIVEDEEGGKVTLTTSRAGEVYFDTVVIATGHAWKEEDLPDQGYYGSPWPISKLLPAVGELHRFTIGTLGASLSAFDVITSLAHRHGKFSREGSNLTYESYPDTEAFYLNVHSAKGWLPHLQFDQEEPFREVYRHATREEILSMRDERGFLRIETFFDKVCRPTLRDAFRKDGMSELVQLLDDPEFDVSDFVEKMSEDHSYTDAFDGMRKEMKEARASVLGHKPVHWKEVVDDLMYTLNFHAELLPAEDHLLLTRTIMPFLLNVIAAMPLRSGEILLALHSAGKLDLVSGYVELKEPDKPGTTTISVSHEDHAHEINYHMFVDCSGQKSLELDHYPFPSLVKNGTVREARATFLISEIAAECVGKEKLDKIFREGSLTYLRTGGIDIDATYRTIKTNGMPNECIYDIAFSHTLGHRPYSYGLQACNATAAIVVETWATAAKKCTSVEGDLSEVSKQYDDI